MVIYRFNNYNDFFSCQYWIQMMMLMAVLTSLPPVLNIPKVIYIIFTLSFQDVKLMSGLRWGHTEGSAQKSDLCPLYPMLHVHKYIPSIFQCLQCFSHQTPYWIYYFSSGTCHPQWQWHVQRVEEPSCCASPAGVLLQCHQQGGVPGRGQTSLPGSGTLLLQVRSAFGVPVPCCSSMV